MGRKRTAEIKDEYLMVTCTECGTVLREAHAVVSRQLLRGHPCVLCGPCSNRDEEPPQVQLVYSNWAPWGEQPVIPIGDLLTAETHGRFLEKHRHAKPA
jgi:hypothetical protein